jgi:hypothetical protein
MTLTENEKISGLINQVIAISGLLKEDRCSEIDLSLIEKEASDLAFNFIESKQGMIDELLREFGL